MFRVMFNSDNILSTISFTKKTKINTNRIKYFTYSVESEHLYAKSLSKTASKLNKACREVPGTLADAWRNIAAEMESRSEVHRQFSATMTKEIVKPLKQLLENQNKARKLVNTFLSQLRKFGKLFLSIFLLFLLFFCCVKQQWMSKFLSI